MRLRNVKNAQEKLEQSSYFVKNPQDYQGRWGVVHLEIGCGKGDFLIGMAKKYPNIFFVGMEKESSVLVRAIEKVDLENLDNIKFICADALDLRSIFAQEVETIYLNFSDPWPKKKHHKRRLTSREYLIIYDDIFSGQKHIIQKTDNIDLFAFSLEEFSKHGYILKKVSLDLHKENMDNVMTEYERKFSLLGYKINYVEVISEI